MYILGTSIGMQDIETSINFVQCFKNDLHLL